MYGVARHRFSAASGTPGIEITFSGLIRVQRKTRPDDHFNYLRVGCRSRTTPRATTIVVSVDRVKSFTCGSGHIDVFTAGYGNDTYYSWAPEIAWGDPNDPILTKGNDTVVNSDGILSAARPIDIVGPAVYSVRGSFGDSKMEYHSPDVPIRRRWEASGTRGR